MKVRLIVAVSILSAACVASGGAGAHHSIGGEFSSESVTVSGIVTELQLINPHAYILIDVENDGQVEQWVLTMGPATKLIRGSGWTPEIVMPGEIVTATGRQARRGNGMYIAALTKADGTALISSLEE